MSISTEIARAYAFAARVSPCHELSLPGGSEARFEKLCREYKKHPICVFTGAGVSFTGAKEYRAPGWWGLLEEIASATQPNRPAAAQRDAFARLKKRCGNLPWRAATELERLLGEDRFRALLAQKLLRRTTKRDPEDKQLPKNYLNQAHSLNAVIAFCSELSHFENHPCYRPNPNVRAVLTMNYDCYLESGATRKHHSNVFKPRSGIEKDRNDTPGQSSTPAGEVLPVYHLHGYLWYQPQLFVLPKECENDVRRLQVSDRLRQCFARDKALLSESARLSQEEEDLRWRLEDQGTGRAYTIARKEKRLHVEKPRRTLIITEQSYRMAYRAGQFTHDTIRKYLSQCSTLFIGVSFDDECLLKLLEALAKRPGSPQHYALMRQDTSPTLLQRLEERCRVAPILYWCHEQMPSLLGRLYRSRLESQGITSVTNKKNRRHRLRPMDYWELLLYNKA